MVAEGWSEAQKRAYVLADNKLTLNTAWDLKGLDFDLELIGFSLDESAGCWLTRRPA